MCHLTDEDCNSPPDSWVNLFPTQFEESYPFPSFNTRDLDTVDNGCFKRLPGLLEHLRTGETKQKELEVVIAHYIRTAR
jgi:phosphatidylinositol glycan class O